MAYKTKFTGRYLSDCYDYQTAIEAVIEAQYKRAQSDYRSFKAQERAVPAPYQVTLDCLKALKDAFANNKHQPLALHWHVEQFIVI